jgi:uncharacterized linocin/CFP29 family protein
MHSDLVEIGWTEAQWNRITTTVIEEAQKARVAAQGLPLSGPEDPTTVAVPPFTLFRQRNRIPPFPPNRRLAVNSDPDLPLTTIAINVQLRTHEIADPDLTAALGMFRRAANQIARVEDALVFNGRILPNLPPFGVGPAITSVCTVSGDGFNPGLFWRPVRFQLRLPPPPRGIQLVPVIQRAVGVLEGSGHQGPFACFLSSELFADAYNPTGNLVLPRDRFLPFLQGPLLRSSAIIAGLGAVVALSGNPVEIVVGSDISVRFLQATPEPRYVFRVSERIALRIKESSAIVVLRR